MKRTITTLLLLLSLATMAQVTPKSKTRTDGTFTEVDHYATFFKRLGIPTSETDAITGGGTPETSIKLFYNRTLNQLRTYDPVTATYGGVGFTLPKASATVRGGIKVGPGLTMIGDSLSTVATGPSAIKGEGSFTANTGYGSSNSYSLGTTLADTLYQVFIQVRASNHGSGSFVMPIKVSRSTTSFSVNMMSGSGSPTGLLNWLVLPSSWTGSSGGGGGGSYTLPAASTTVRGGVKIGTGLNMAGDVLSATGGANPDTSIYRTADNSFTKAQAQPRIILTTLGGSGPASLNTTTNTLNIPVYTGGGGGSVTQVTSANADIGVVNTTSTPVLTLNASASATASTVMKRDASGDAAVANLYVTDAAYGSGWNNNNQTPTKNAIWDKIETISGSTTNLALGTPTSTNYPITNSSGTGITLPASTTSVAGLQSAPDKTKLDGISSGTYSPTIANVGNTTSLSFTYAAYTRIGNLATVEAIINFSETTSSISSQISVSLPFGNCANNQVTGTAVTGNGTESGTVSYNSSTTALVYFPGNATTGARIAHIRFTYTVI